MHVSDISCLHVSFASTPTGRSRERGVCMSQHSARSASLACTLSRTGQPSSGGRQILQTWMVREMVRTRERWVCTKVPRQGLVCVASGTTSRYLQTRYTGKIGRCKQCYGGTFAEVLLCNFQPFSHPFCFYSLLASDFHMPPSQRIGTSICS